MSQGRGPSCESTLLPDHPGGCAARPFQPATRQRACTVSLTMIVRDEEANLPRCLESVRDLFDELVVVDTGSVDRTREIAAGVGARLFDFVWCDDFAVARNAALTHSAGDYIFWLDADDAIESTEREKLRRLLDGLRPGGGIAYTVCIRGAGIPAPGCYQVRLVPSRPDLRWMCPVHEVIWPAVRRAGMTILPSGVALNHTGYADPIVHSRKRLRNEKILSARLSECPDDPFALWHMGRIAASRSDWRVALELYRKCLAGWPSDLVADAPRAYLAQAEWEIGDRRAALKTCGESLAVAPHHAPAWFAKGQMHAGLGETAEAEECWRHVLTLAGGDPARMSDYDPRFEANRARRELAVIALRRGDRTEAAELYRRVLADHPDDREV